MDILSKLFGGSSRIKIMRLFLLNPNDFFEKKDVGMRCRVPSGPLSKELKMLEEIGFIKKRMMLQIAPAGMNGSKKQNKKKVFGLKLNLDFSLLSPLENMLIATEPFANEDIIRRFR
ncbi:hypothetical protein L0Y49_03330, partial [bacterium]|nr:hypothetical protein [bacterium]